eukprot:CFRG1062T1
MKYLGSTVENRTIKIKHGHTDIHIPVPGSLRETAELLTRDFHQITSENTDAIEPFELHHRFLKFVLEYETLDQGLAITPLLHIVYEHFCTFYLEEKGIHTKTAHMDEDTRVQLIRLCGRAHSRLVATGLIDANVKPLHAANHYALFNAVKQGKASISAVFGGQGASTVLEELEQVYSTYPECQEMVRIMCEVVKQCAASKEAKEVGLHVQGLDIEMWLDDKITRPSMDYLLSSPVSFPLIGITQLTHYWIMLKVMRIAPSDILSLLSGVTGHSQGIVAAVVVASSLDEETFVANCNKALKLLFWMGTRIQLAYPLTTLNPTILADSLDHDEGTPTPMLAVAYLPVQFVSEKVELANRHLAKNRQLSIALINGPRSVVVAGHPQSLYGLQVTLRAVKAKKTESQNRIPFSKRKQEFTTKYLPVTAPFHTPHLSSVLESLAVDIKREGLEWSTKLEVPVWSTFDGTNLEKYADLTTRMVSLICNETVNFEAATSHKVTHILEFGPGGMGGVGSILYRNKLGTGVRVVLMGAETTTDPELESKAACFSAEETSLNYADDWAKEYAPHLVRVSGSQETHIQTRMSTLLGKPPIMVAGMTPTTVNEHFISAIINAGYHCELAGGGHYNEKSLRDTIDNILKNTTPGSSVTVNVLFLNARQWAFQYLLIRRMRQEGYPIEGLCIAAGVPSIDNATEIIESCREAGIRHVSFKPGSVSAINEVVAIAERNPDMPIMLQWTGGRAGGHHSFEDFHQPILKTYASIRKRKNLVLVAGSGVGDSESAMPFLTGEWSTGFEYPLMPFDGVLMGSRVMVAKEALTSDSVKHRLCDGTSGIALSEESQWEKTYEGVVGGVTTVTSELGEPIHKVATRGVLLWKKFDKLYFSLPKEDMIKKILKDKKNIIASLNADFQKVYFGQKLSTGEAVDLDHMTYLEVVLRMIDLMYISYRKSWTHVSYRKCVYDMIIRTAERFAGSFMPIGLDGSCVLDDEDIDDVEDENELNVPKRNALRLLSQFPAAATQFMSTPDIHFFVSICNRRGQKPVPFIPIIDENFRTYFKKDSLWMSEDIDAVVGQDVERVCILQGPVAAHYSVKANEPIAELMGGIYTNMIDTLRLSNKDEKIVDGLGVVPRDNLPPLTSLSGVRTVRTSSVIQMTLPREGTRLPDTQVWFEHICEGQNKWLRALLFSSTILKGSILTTSNSMARLFRPRPGQRVRIELGVDGGAECVEIYDTGFSPRMKQKGHTVPVVRALCQNGVDIEVTLNTPSKLNHQTFVPLHLKFKYVPENCFAPVHEQNADHNKNVNQFYSKIWFGDSPPKAIPTADAGDATSSTDVGAAKCVSQHTITREEITSFCRATNNRSENSVLSRVLGDKKMSRLEAPMDLAIVVGWKAIMGALLNSNVNADLLNLVHTSNSFRVLNPNEDPLMEGDVCETIAELSRVEAERSGGTSVGVTGVIYRNSIACIEVNSTFFYRESVAGTSYAGTFEKKTLTPVEVKVHSVKEVAILKSKPWLRILSPEDLVVGATFIFYINTVTRYDSADLIGYVQATGKCVRELETGDIVDFAHIKYERTHVKGNAVVAFLERHGARLEEETLFDGGGYSLLPRSEAYVSTVTAPPMNHEYAKVSGDTNPIHVNPYFSDLVGLPGTITHGMWTAASIRRLVEIFASDDQPRRVCSYMSEFLGMVLPGDQLETKLTHVGMAKGKMIVNVDTYNQDNVRVLHGVAHVQQPSTAYVFTGQGSQEKGMGMELYADSTIAKGLWDRADVHFRDRYGFSILSIVQDNPKAMTVYFGGVKGAAIRDFYMSLRYSVLYDDGSTENLALFPSITKDTQFYLFQHPDGLLSATQFTQPALVLFEMAAYSDMKYRGLVQSGATFAGHSLGEYASLAAVGDVLSVESVMDVVFYRGMTMQYAVKRNADGMSDYGMIAINPSRVGGGLGETELNNLCSLISNITSSLLEIVNYNVENWQYVAAGTLLCLETLTQVLNVMKVTGVNVAAVSEDDVTAVINQCVAQVTETSRDGRVLLTKGYACIPLSGIDVPFHSRFLLSGVGPFRKYLRDSLDSNIDLSLLENKYIPNLTAIPFAVTREYCREVFNVTQSTEMKDLAMVEGPLDIAQRQEVGFSLLVELLAFQFASPVQWIKTQDIILGERNTERLVEIGPSPTLAGMFNRTIQLKYKRHDQLVSQHRQVIAFSKNRQELYFEFQEEENAANSDEESHAVQIVTAAPTVQAPISNRAPGQTINQPITTADTLRCVIALKLKKRMDAIPMEKSVKDLVGGKSALQNEILGDVSAEMGTSNMPERVEELPLSELSEKISGSGRLGKLLSAQVNKSFSAKMPAGFTLKKANAHLLNTHGLGGASAEGALLHAMTIEPATRLKDDASAQAWLDESAGLYAQLSGISLCTPSCTPSTMSSGDAGGGGKTLATGPDTVTALEVMQTIIAVKTRASTVSIKPNETLKDVAQGKSALTNEIMGDVQAEFGTSFVIPADPAEMPLSTLASAVNVPFAHPGKVSKALINRVTTQKLPGGFNLSACRDYLGGKYGLSSIMLDGAMLHATAMEPKARLGSKEEANAWLDNVATSYASMKGITLGGATGGSGNGGGGGGMVADVRTSETYQTDMRRHAQLLRDNVTAICQYFGKDEQAGQKRLDELTTLLSEVEHQVSQFANEHGEFYTNNIQPKFSALKARTYDSYWNWVRQDFVSLMHDVSNFVAEANINNGGVNDEFYLKLRVSAEGQLFVARWTRLCNRHTSQLISMIKYNMAHTSHGNTLSRFLGVTAEGAEEEILAGNPSPVFKTEIQSKQPNCEVRKDGELVYSESRREALYIDEMKQPLSNSASPSPADCTSTLRNLADMLNEALSTEEDGRTHAEKHSRAVADVINSLRKQESSFTPTLSLKKQIHGQWTYDSNNTQKFHNVLHDIQSRGLCLKNKNVLITGAGKGSIGESILDVVLAAGANVIVTSSSFNYNTTQYIRFKYEAWGGHGSALTLLPFNQASVQDVRALVDHVFDTMKTDLDYVIPFAAISEGGREIDDIDDRSELAHRMMLTNLTRLLGAIKAKKRMQGSITRPTLALLPLSPNHGVFGGDGLYAESKIGLEVLFNKWRSEGWSKYLAIAGVVIGWTRGTGLMSQNNVIAQDIEGMGVRTFSTMEMAYNIAGLLHQHMVDVAVSEPIWADFSGGLDSTEGLEAALSDARKTLNERSTMNTAITNESIVDFQIEKGEMPRPHSIERRCNLVARFPPLECPENKEDMEKLKSLIDLDRVVVVTGYGEVGPYGNARTRWEMERDGIFSLEGCIEMAWIMGYVKHFNGVLNGEVYSGWVDVSSGASIKDVDIKAAYEEKILTHSGIRLIEPELFDGYNPHKKMFLRQVAIERDFGPINCSEEDALEYKHEHGEDVTIFQDEDGEWKTLFKKGAQLYIPKALQFDRRVAGQIPTGWKAERFGVPDDIVAQVDPVTLYNIVSTVEALICSGITDPYEFYQYVHVSEVGNTSGGGVGGIRANSDIYKNRFVEKQVQGDILQESFINTMPAWVNMLLLSSSGPIKTPVGACATAVESVEIGVDTILSGKAKVVICGGYDDFQEVSTYEFASMKATSSSVAEESQGRTPKEMSRPTTTTRSGFMESQGAGNQILMSAQLAVDMGLPIYGIVALTNTATDKEGRSVPAPGQGILTTAREMRVRGGKGSHLLDLNYRTRQLQFQLSEINRWMEHEIAELEHLTASNKAIDNEPDFSDRVNVIYADAERKRKAAQRVWGTDFYHNDASIAPVRGALAVFGLTVDDIAVSSFHGTSTKANDTNESDVVNSQMAHLGRSEGNPVCGVFQKYLTGHPKGAAAAWMLNGVLQIMRDGVVPGNRNADNVDILLREYSHIYVPSRSVNVGTRHVKAAVLKSFGFGQVGGEVLVIHPSYVLGLLSDEDLADYTTRRDEREAKASQYVHDAMSDVKPYVRVKTSPPYSQADEKAVYLNPLARAQYDNTADTWLFSSHDANTSTTGLHKSTGTTPIQSPVISRRRMEQNLNVNMLKTQLWESMMTNLKDSQEHTQSDSTQSGFGVDVELVDSINISNEVFVDNNFTQREIEYCLSQPDARASFAGRWSAKEAVIKAVSNYNLDVVAGWKGAHAGLKDIEIIPSVSKAPEVILHGHAAEIVRTSGVSAIKVSISHSGEYSVATAYAS